MEHIIATQDPNNGNGRTKGRPRQAGLAGQRQSWRKAKTLVLGAESARDGLHRGLSFRFPHHIGAGHHHQCRLLPKC